MVEMRIEHKVASMEDLRDLCITSDWFDAGNSKDYAKFLHYAGKPAEPSVLLDMANQIFDHSSDFKYSEDRKEGLASIIWTLYRLGVDHNATVL